MAIVSQISVGDILYYQVDDIPTHTAPKGSVALMSESIYDNGFTYINNDGGTTWLKCICQSKGGISLTNATNTVDFGSLTPTSWYAFNAVPTGASWALKPSSTSEWALTTQDTGTDDLTYTGSTTMRAIVSQTVTLRGGTRWMNFETGVSYNFTVPLNWNEAYTGQNDETVSQASHHILEMNTNDYLLSALSPINRQGGGGVNSRQFLAKHAQLTAVRIDEPLILQSSATTLIDETFESGDFNKFVDSS